MRILHVISTLDPAAGGPPSVASRLAAAQAALGHTVTIASALPPERQSVVAASLQTIPSIDRVRLEYLPAPRRLPALERLTADSDVVHMHGLWERLLPETAAVARAQSVPYVIAPHGMLYPWSLHQKRLKKRLALALGYRRMLNGAAFIHALNADEQRAIEPLNLWPPTRVVPNGVFTDEFRQLPPPGTFHRAHPELAGRPYVLFLSRLHPGKGLDHLGAAFPAVARAVPDLQLVVAGPDSGARAPFEQQIARAGLSDRVHLVGPTYGQMKFAAFADACCFCLPSDHETFSMAIVEAMGCGVPVVISDACHFPEVAEAGAGKIVPRDPESLAAALTRVASDPARRQAMGRAGRDLVNDRFNWPDIAKRCVDTYTDIIEDGWDVAAPERQRLRVLHVIATIDPEAGGPPAVATRLAAAQAALGHDVRLLAYAPRSADRVRLTTGSIPGFRRVRVEYVPTGGARERLFARRARFRLRAAMRRADVLHLHNIWDPIIPAAAAEARAQRKPYLVVAHGMLDPWSLSQRWLKKRIALLLTYRRMLQGAAAIHALNADERRLMEPLALRTPIEIIPNGCFLEELEPLPDPGHFRRQHPELEHRPYVLFLSRLHYKKGLDVLADAFHAVAADLPDLHLVVAGPDDGARDPFIRQIERYDLRDRVLMAGALYGPDKVGAMVDAACLCLPSRQEGFSMVVTEAMATGLPVVVSDACHFPEVAEAGAGLVVPLDPAAVAAALRRIVPDPDLRRSMSDAGRRLVADRFTWPRVAQRTISVYRTLLDAQGPQQPQPTTIRPATGTIMPAPTPTPNP